MKRLKEPGESFIRLFPVYSASGRSYNVFYAKTLLVSTQFSLWASLPQIRFYASKRTMPIQTWCFIGGLRLLIGPTGRIIRSAPTSPLCLQEWRLHLFKTTWRYPRSHQRLRYKRCSIDSYSPFLCAGITLIQSMMRIRHACAYSWQQLASRSVQREDIRLFYGTSKKILF